MRKRAVFFSILLPAMILAVLFSSGCKNKAAEVIAQARAREEAEIAKDDWTILLYLCGSDLESEGGLASANLAEIAKLNIPDNINVLFATGGSTAWKTAGIDPNYIEYFTISGQGEIKRVAQKKRASMGQPSTLGEFLAFGSSSYPAKRYGVILWNHGGGTAGVAYDDIYNGDCLSLPDLDRAFRLGSVHYTFVGMDACLMANMETAFVLEPYANYLIASEETVPGEGWDYAALLHALIKSPNIGGVSLGKAVCDSYYAKCVKNGTENIATLSVIDLSKIHALGKAFDKMTTEMTGLTEDFERFKTLRGGILRAENYGGNTDNEGYRNLVDMGDMVLGAQDVLSETGEQVLDALFDAVVYKVSGPARSHANGLSCFYPLNSDPESLDLYTKEAAYSANYLHFLEASTRDWEMPADFQGYDFGTPQTRGNALSIGNTDIQISAETSVDKKGNFTLEFTEGLDYLQQVRFVLYMLNGESGEFLYLGEDDDFYVSEEGDVYQDNFQGLWPALNGQLISLNLMETNEDYFLYSVPLLVNEEAVNMRCIYDFESGEYEILGLWRLSEHGAAEREVRQFEHGDYVQTLMRGVDLDTAEGNDYIVGEFAVDREVSIEDAELPDGDYIYQFVYENLLGQKESSAAAHIEARNGELIVGKLERAY